MAKKKKEKTLDPEWSVPFDTERLGSEKKKIALEITPPEAKKLAKRLGLLSLESLKAQVTIERTRGRVFHVSGKLTAEVVQACVLTGEPIAATVKDNFEAWYADPAQAVSLSKARRERDIAKGNVEMPLLEEAEDPEPLVEGNIDLGEMVTQFLSLAIDPYPHAKGAKLLQSGKSKKAAADEDFANPFAGLKAWKAKMQSE
ncbi:MAG: DUF177 domain-containing protein [Alphaproteobacteria bacterium]|nr:DUF177 domain-containing protein [Alphaproteobacteria bacterium]